MAITNRYCTGAGAGLHDGSSWANAWSFVEAGANAVAGDDVYCSGSVTLLADWSPANSGTNAQPIRYIGCSGGVDLTDGYQGWTTPTTIDTTNFFTVNGGGFRINASTTSSMMLNFDVTGSYAVASTAILTVVSGWSVINCRANNTDGTTTSVAFRGGGFSTIIANCEFKSVGGHAVVPLVTGRFFNCVVKSVDNSGFASNGASGCFSNCLVYECGRDAFSASANGWFVVNCTMANNIDDAVAISANSNINVVNCMITGNASYINHANDFPSTLFRNRTRDNTADRINGLDWPDMFPVTTDTGGDETDYFDSANDDFRLVYNSPGARGTYGPVANDIGAYQHLPDYPAVTNVRDNDTTDGVTGTLSSNKIVKSNPVPGNWDDSQIIGSNLLVGVTAGVGGAIVGTAVEETHTANDIVSTSGGAWDVSNIIPANLLIGVTAGIGGAIVGIAIEEIHTANQVLSSAGGNWDDSNLTGQPDFTANVRDGIAGGLGWLGGYDNSTNPDHVISSQGGNWIDTDVTAGNLLVGAVAGVGGAIVGTAIEETHTDDEVIDTAADPGNFVVSTLSNGLIYEGTAWGLGLTGARVEPDEDDVRAGVIYSDPLSPKEGTLTGGSSNPLLQILLTPGKE